MTDIEQDDHADIRNAVAKLCAQFPGEYWRKLDREMAYPSAFVDALTKAGYLSVLIPEEYDGAGLKLSAATAILEEIHRAGCNAGACHAQMRAAELMIREGCTKFEAGLTPGEEANMAKLLGADAAWAAAEACLQTHGGFGFAEEYDVERKFRETRLYQVAPISTNLILSYIAEHVLGLPRSY